MAKVLASAQRHQLPANSLFRVVPRRAAELWEVSDFAFDKAQVALFLLNEVNEVHDSNSRLSARNLFLVGRRKGTGQVRHFRPKP